MDIRWIGIFSFLTLFEELRLLNKSKKSPSLAILGNMAVSNIFSQRIMDNHRIELNIFTDFEHLPNYAFYLLFVGQNVRNVAVVHLLNAGTTGVEPDQRSWPRAPSRSPV